MIDLINEWLCKFYNDSLVTLNSMFLYFAHRTAKLEGLELLNLKIINATPLILIKITNVGAK